MQQEEAQQMPTQAAAAPMQPQPEEGATTSTAPMQPQPEEGATTSTAPTQPQPEQGATTTPAAPVQPQPALFPYPWMMTTRPPMAICRFGHRHFFFQLGFVGLVVATILFTVGFSVPAWADNTGLWQICQNDSCDYYVGIGPDWLDGVRSLETLAVACFVLSLVVELYQDVFQSPPPSDNKAVEILGMLAGVLGVGGLALFAAKLEHKLRYHYDRYNYRDGYDFYYYKPDLNWGFWLAAAGVSLGSLSSVLIAFSRVRHAKLTKLALAKCRVYTMHHNASPAVPMGYGYPAPAYPYPYLYPAAPVMMAPVPTTVSAPAQGMPVSQTTTAAQEMPASQMMAAQEMPASRMTSAQEMPASQMTAAQEMPASQMMAAQEMPASQMTAAHGIPMTTFTPAPGDRTEEADAPGNGQICERL